MVRSGSRTRHAEQLAQAIISASHHPTSWQVGGCSTWWGLALPPPAAPRGFPDTLSTRCLHAWKNKDSLRPCYLSQRLSWKGNSALPVCLSLRAVWLQAVPLHRMELGGQDGLWSGQAGDGGWGIKRGEVGQSPKYWCLLVEMPPAPCGLLCSAPRSPLGATVAPGHFEVVAERCWRLGTMCLVQLSPGWGWGLPCECWLRGR